MSTLFRLALGGVLLGIAIALDGDAVLVALGALAAMAAYKPEFARYWRNTAKIVKKNAELLALRAESPSAQWIHEACKSILR